MITAPIQLFGETMRNGIGIKSDKAIRTKILRAIRTPCEKCVYFVFFCLIFPRTCCACVVHIIGLGHSCLTFLSFRIVSPKRPQPILVSTLANMLMLSTASSSSIRKVQVWALAS